VEHGTAKELSIMNPYRDKVIGTLLGGERIVESALGVDSSYLLVLGGIWKDKFPVEAQKMREDFEQGNLTFSMEVAFGGMRCGDCNETYSAKDPHVCEHLLNHRSAGASVIRWAKDIVFSAFSVVTTPAWEDAHAVALGSTSNEENTIANQINELKELLGGKMSDEKTKSYTDAEIKALREAAEHQAKEAVAAEMKDLKKQILEAEKTLAEFQTQLDEASTTHETKLTELAEEKTKIESEFATYKKDQEQAAFLSERFAKLANPDIDVEITADNKKMYEKLILAMETDEEFEAWLATLTKKEVEEGDDVIKASKKDALNAPTKKTTKKSAKEELDDIFEDKE